MSDDARQKFLGDVVIGFVEDYGYSGWRQIVSGSYDPDRATAKFIDVEDEDEIYEVNVGVVLAGLAHLRNDQTQVAAYIRNMAIIADEHSDAGEIDAEIADVIVQLGIFGEIVYG